MRIEVTSLAIEAVKQIRIRRIGDARGSFAETWNARAFAEAGIDAAFVQDNCSFSDHPATIRGLHYQRAPAAQAKLVRVVRGRIFDVAVDLRPGSPTFGRHVTAELSAEGGEQIFIPAAFAHGFCTLEAGTEVAYKLTDFYAPEHETGIIWNDPDLAIEWPLEGRPPILSEKDKTLPRLAETRPSF
jgi:dTDP-4-dehydrorhamnose 3,5-epimerase